LPPAARVMELRRLRALRRPWELVHDRGDGFVLDGRLQRSVCYCHYSDHCCVDEYIRP
jgi:hypothetical protein